MLSCQLSQNVLRTMRTTRNLMLICAALCIVAASAVTPVFAQDKNKAVTAEQVAETVVFVYGRREGLAQIRRTGLERGRVTVSKNDGATEQVTYERRFVRGEKAEKDKIRVDQKMPTVEYSLLFKDGRVSGIINGTEFTPRQDATEDLISQMRHGIDALLRYKENNSQVVYVGKEKIKNIDMHILDLTDTEKNRTRYYISATPDIRKTGRILWLEYESPVDGTPTKFKRTFHNYNYAQGTLVPFRSVLYAGDKQVAETQILTVTYGIKMEDSVFQAAG